MRRSVDQPIGFATVTETPQGLLVRGKLLLDTVAGSEAYSRLKAGVLKALSVGFQLPKDGFTLKDGIRVISRAVLKEISLVVFPANPLAAVTTVKDEERSSFAALLGHLRVHLASGVTPSRLFHAVEIFGMTKGAVLRGTAAKYMGDLHGSRLRSNWRKWAGRFDSYLTVTRTVFCVFLRP